MDCNNCIYININEDQQNEIYKNTGNKPDHICTKYNKRLFHFARTKEHSSVIYPLEECDKEVKE